MNAEFEDTTVTLSTAQMATLERALRTLGRALRSIQYHRPAAEVNILNAEYEEVLALYMHIFGNRLEAK